MTDEPVQDGEPSRESTLPADTKSALVWESDDRRLFLITLAATVAGTVIGVAVLGLAFAAARYARNTLTPQGWRILAAATFGAMLVLALRVWFLEHKDKAKLTARIATTIYAIVVSFFLLIWIGVAAGIK
jgi:hypothetical protein